jgi:hypothetical protein
VVDVKSTLARTGLGATPRRPDTESQIEYLAWFRFPVTWTYISVPASESNSEVAPKPPPPSQTLTLAPIVPAPISRGPAALDADEPGGRLRPAGSAMRWEMMVPKMDRPVTKSVAPPVPIYPAPGPTSSPLTATAKIPMAGAAPAFAVAEESRFARAWRPLALLAIIAVAIGFTVWVRPAKDPSSREQVADSFHRGGWVRRSLLPPGRMMSVYEPSRDESDYRIEFEWVPDERGVGWVVRTSDAGDYYAARVSLLQPRSSVVVAEHFTVRGGLESAHSRRVVQVGNHAGLVRVRMDAIGPAFTLSLQGSPADYWTDERLNSGALGFYDERGLRPVIQSLRFTFIKKGVTQVAVASLP